MDIFLYGLVCTFIPGLVCRILLERLIFCKNNDQFHFLLHSFLLGVISYIVLSLIYFVIGKFGYYIQSPDFLTGNVVIRDVIFATPIAVIVAFLFSIAEKNNWLHWFAGILGITNKTAEPDIWSFTLHQKAVTDNPWVNVRYKGLVYQGKVVAYSDVSDKPELLLSNVAVFSESEATDRAMLLELYRVNTVYLSLTLGEFSIELLIN
ncbi:MAG: DUF6338 family protein [Deferribacteraceae bacterium]|jgi:hypothetical protein|nr:DUF6338 family protein [Deferribacteraceae bacterium]